MKTFTSSTGEPRKFAIDDEVFRCAADLPAGAATFLARMAKAVPTDRILMLGDFLDLIILPEDAERFAARLGDPTHPITMNKFGEIIEWMLEEYGVRPTQPSSSSANGSSPNLNGGADSTGGVLPAPSIPVSSTSSAS